jgi:hypothetical protein
MSDPNELLPNVQQQTDNAVAEFIRAIKHWEDSVVDDASETYTVPSDYPLQVNGKRVCTVQMAVMAMHLVTADVILKILPNRLQQLESKMESTVKNWIEARIAGYLIQGGLSRFPGIGLLKFLTTQLISLFNASKAQRDIEFAIRAASAERMKQLHDGCLFGNNPRKTEDVATRHTWKPKKHRAPNKGSGLHSH